SLCELASNLRSKLSTPVSPRDDETIALDANRSARLRPKAADSTAQGNALGKGDHERRSPERARLISLHAALFCPFRAALAVPIRTQAFGLGYRVPPRWG